MYFLYYIKKDGKWLKVDSETYWAYPGEKKKCAPTEGLVRLQKYLQPLRW